MYASGLIKYHYRCYGRTANITPCSRTGDLNGCSIVRSRIFYIPQTQLQSNTSMLFLFPFNCHMIHLFNLVFSIIGSFSLIQHLDFETCNSIQQDCGIRDLYEDCHEGCLDRPNDCTTFGPISKRRYQSHGTFGSTFEWSLG